MSGSNFFSSLFGNTNISQQQENGFTDLMDLMKEVKTNLPSSSVQDNKSKVQYASFQSQENSFSNQIFPKQVEEQKSNLDKDQTNDFELNEDDLDVGWGDNFSDEDDADQKDDKEDHKTIQNNQLSSAFTDIFQTSSSNKNDQNYHHDNKSQQQQANNNKKNTKFEGKHTLFQKNDLDKIEEESYGEKSYQDQNSVIHNSSQYSVNNQEIKADQKKEETTTSQDNYKKEGGNNNNTFKNLFDSIPSFGNIIQESQKLPPSKSHENKNSNQQDKSNVSRSNTQTINNPQEQKKNISINESTQRKPDDQQIKNVQLEQKLQPNSNTNTNNSIKSISSNSLNSNSNQNLINNSNNIFKKDSSSFSQTQINSRKDSSSNGINYNNYQKDKINDNLIGDENKVNSNNKNKNENDRKIQKGRDQYNIDYINQIKEMENILYQEKLEMQQNLKQKINQVQMWEEDIALRQESIDRQIEERTKLDKKIEIKKSILKDENQILVFIETQTQLQELQERMKRTVQNHNDQLSQINQQMKNQQIQYKQNEQELEKLLKSLNEKYHQSVQKTKKQRESFQKIIKQANLKGQLKEMKEEISSIIQQEKEECIQNLKDLAQQLQKEKIVSNQCQKEIRKLRSDNSEKDLKIQSIQEHSQTVESNQKEYYEKQIKQIQEKLTQNSQKQQEESSKYKKEISLLNSKSAELQQKIDINLGEIEELKQNNTEKDQQIKSDEDIILQKNKEIQQIKKKLAQQEKQNTLLQNQIKEGESNVNNEKEDLEKEISSLRLSFDEEKKTFQQEKAKFNKQLQENISQFEVQQQNEISLNLKIKDLQKQQKQNEIENTKAMNDLRREIKSEFDQKLLIQQQNQQEQLNKLKQEDTTKSNDINEKLKLIQQLKKQVQEQQATIFEQLSKIGTLEQFKHSPNKHSHPSSENVQQNVERSAVDNHKNNKQQQHQIIQQSLQEEVQQSNFTNLKQEEDQSKLINQQNEDDNSKIQNENEVDETYFHETYSTTLNQIKQEIEKQQSNQNIFNQELIIEDNIQGDNQSQNIQNNQNQISISSPQKENKQKQEDEDIIDVEDNPWENQSSSSPKSLQQQQQIENKQEQIQLQQQQQVIQFKKDLDISPSKISQTTPKKQISQTPKKDNDNLINVDENIWGNIQDIQQQQQIEQQQKEQNDLIEQQLEQQDKKLEEQQELQKQVESQSYPIPQFLINNEQHESQQQAKKKKKKNKQNKSINNAINLFEESTPSVNDIQQKEDKKNDIFTEQKDEQQVDFESNLVKSKQNKTIDNHKEKIHVKTEEDIQIEKQNDIFSSLIASKIVNVENTSHPAQQGQTGLGQAFGFIKGIFEKPMKSPFNFTKEDNNSQKIEQKNNNFLNILNPFSSNKKQQEVDEAKQSDQIDQIKTQKQENNSTQLQADEKLKKDEIQSKKDTEQPKKKEETQSFFDIFQNQVAQFQSGQKLGTQQWQQQQNESSDNNNSGSKSIFLSFLDPLINSSKNTNELKQEVIEVQQVNKHSNQIKFIEQSKPEKDQQHFQDKVKLIESSQGKQEEQSQINQEYTNQILNKEDLKIKEDIKNEQRIQSPQIKEQLNNSFQKLDTSNGSNNQQQNKNPLQQNLINQTKIEVSSLFTSSQQKYEAQVQTQSNKSEQKKPSKAQLIQDQCFTDLINGDQPTEKLSQKLTTPIDDIFSVFSEKKQPQTKKKGKTSKKSKKSKEDISTQDQLNQHNDQQNNENNIQKHENEEEDNAIQNIEQRKSFKSDNLQVSEEQQLINEYNQFIDNHSVNFKYNQQLIFKQYFNNQQKKDNQQNINLSHYQNQEKYIVEQLKEEINESQLQEMNKNTLEQSNQNSQQLKLDNNLELNQHNIEKFDQNIIQDIQDENKVEEQNQNNNVEELKNEVDDEEDQFVFTRSRDTRRNETEKENNQQQLPVFNGFHEISEQSIQLTQKHPSQIQENDNKNYEYKEQTDKQQHNKQEKKESLIQTEVTFPNTDSNSQDKSLSYISKEDNVLEQNGNESIDFFKHQLNVNNNGNNKINSHHHHHQYHQNKYDNTPKQIGSVGIQYSNLNLDSVNASPQIKALQNLSIEGSERDLGQAFQNSQNSLGLVPGAGADRYNMNKFINQMSSLSVSQEINQKQNIHDLDNMDEVEKSLGNNPLKLSENRDSLENHSMRSLGLSIMNSETILHSSNVIEYFLSEQKKTGDKQLQQNRMQQKKNDQSKRKFSEGFQVSSVYEEIDSVIEKNQALEQDTSSSQIQEIDNFSDVLPSSSHHDDIKESEQNNKNTKNQLSYLRDDGVAEEEEEQENGSEGNDSKNLKQIHQDNRNLDSLSQNSENNENKQLVDLLNIQNLDQYSPAFMSIAHKDSENSFKEIKFTLCSVDQRSSIVQSQDIHKGNHDLQQVTQSPIQCSKEFTSQNQQSENNQQFQDDKINQDIFEGKEIQESQENQKNQFNKVNLEYDDNNIEINQQNEQNKGDLSEQGFQQEQHNNDKQIDKTLKDQKIVEINEFTVNTKEQLQLSFSNKLNEGDMQQDNIEKQDFVDDNNNKIDYQFRQDVQQSVDESFKQDNNQEQKEQIDFSLNDGQGDNDNLDIVEENSQQITKLEQNELDQPIKESLQLQQEYNIDGDKVLVDAKAEHIEHQDISYDNNQIASQQEQNQLIAEPIQQQQVQEDLDLQEKWDHNGDNQDIIENNQKPSQIEQDKQDQPVEEPLNDQQEQKVDDDLNLDDGWGDEIKNLDVAEDNDQQVNLKEQDELAKPIEEQRKKEYQQELNLEDDLDLEDNWGDNIANQNVVEENNQNIVEDTQNCVVGAQDVVEDQNKNASLNEQNKQAKLIQELQQDQEKQQKDEDNLELDDGWGENIDNLENPHQQNEQNLHNQVEQEQQKEDIDDKLDLDDGWGINNDNQNDDEQNPNSNDNIKKEGQDQEKKTNQIEEEDLGLSDGWGNNDNMDEDQQNKEEEQGKQVQQNSNHEQEKININQENFEDDLDLEVDDNIWGANDKQNEENIEENKKDGLTSLIQSKANDTQQADKLFENLLSDSQQQMIQNKDIQNQKVQSDNKNDDGWYVQKDTKKRGLSNEQKQSRKQSNDLDLDDDIWGNKINPQDEQIEAQQKDEGTTPLINAAIINNQNLQKNQVICNNIFDNLIDSSIQGDTSKISQSVNNSQILESSSSISNIDITKIFIESVSNANTNKHSSQTPDPWALLANEGGDVKKTKIVKKKKKVVADLNVQKVTQFYVKAEPTNPFLDKSKDKKIDEDDTNHFSNF